MYNTEPYTRMMPSGLTDQGLNLLSRVCVNNKCMQKCMLYFRAVTLAILGLDSAGKTTTTKAFLGGKSAVTFYNICWTVFLDLTFQRTCKMNTVKFNFSYPKK